MNKDYLSELPPDMLATQLSYLPFSDVINVCVVNKKINKFCTDPKYHPYWKSMIINTYGKLPEYKKIIEANKDLPFNYHLYTQLINLLDLKTQLNIYEKQGDNKYAERIKNKLKLIDYKKNLNLIVNMLIDNGTGRILLNGTEFTIKTIKSLYIQLRNSFKKLFSYLPDKTINDVNKFINDDFIVVRSAIYQGLGYSGSDFNILIKGLSIDNYKELKLIQPTPDLPTIPTIPTLLYRI